ncbi:MAG TPA: anaerobic ribonucleoside-triphosphate reductase activating protein [bacterium]|nr:anaerobic ribonucleoside-triphosphate reductase activating protein [bacterium]
MKIGGLQKTSLIDYPDKLSCIIFTQGCNLRCPYCHNPELVLPEKFLPLISAGEIMSFLKKRREYLQGIVVSGGEPCMQENLADFLKEAKKLGYCVKLDTNGTMPDVIKMLIEESLVDYIAMDVKAPLEKYGLLAGVEIDTRKIEESIAILKGSGIDCEFKTTFVFPLLHKEDFEQIGRLTKGARIHYIQHFVPSTAIDEKCLSYPPASEGDFEEARQIMLKHVKECQIR